MLWLFGYSWYVHVWRCKGILYIPEFDAFCVEIVCQALKCRRFFGENFTWWNLISEINTRKKTNNFAVLPAITYIIAVTKAVTKASFTAKTDIIAATTSLYFVTAITYVHFIYVHFLFISYTCVSLHLLLSTSFLFTW